MSRLCDVVQDIDLCTARQTTEEMEHAQLADMRIAALPLIANSTSGEPDRVLSASAACAAMPGSSGAAFKFKDESKPTDGKLTDADSTDLHTTLRIARRQEDASAVCVHPPAIFTL